MSLFLVAGPDDPNPDQEKLRQKLEPETQKYMESFFRAEVPNPYRWLPSLLEIGWFGGRGRKARLEIEVDGKVSCKEVVSVKELNDLIGPGKTPQTLLEAMMPVSQPIVIVDE